MPKPFLLFVAGEASGDRLGEALVRVCVEHGFEARGAGGERMQSAGLTAEVVFADLNVAGFWDVLPRLPLLRAHLRTLSTLVHDPACRALVCIDYPGFNMQLMAQAKRRNVPVFWLAPPQIWAWKRKRAKRFVGQDVHVFFPFEQQAYAAAGVPAVQVAHPMLERILPTAPQTLVPHLWALLPGSRWEQAVRNVSSLLVLGKQLEMLAPQTRAVLVASDSLMCDRLRARWGSQIEVVLAQDDSPLWPQLRGAVCPPGTASLEMALRGVPILVFTRVDVITYVLGRLFLRTRILALPNLLLQSQDIREFVVPALGQLPEALLRELAQWLCNQDCKQAKARSSALCAVLSGPRIVDVFTQFIARSKSQHRQ